MSNEDATPIMQNKRAPFDVKPGDYVFASRWGDCDPGDPWAVGYVEEVGTHNIKLTNSPRMWPCAMKITPEQGQRICEQYPRMERYPMDYEVTPPGELEYASWQSSSVADGVTPCHRCGGRRWLGDEYENEPCPECAASTVPAGVPERVMSPDSKRNEGGA